jgi:ArsR family transcriptional regulator
MTNRKESEWRVEFHKALANPVRIEIVDFLVDGEQCQCDIFRTLDRPQSVISSYLNQMTRAGILTVRRDGTRKMYRIRSSEVERLIRRIRDLARENTSE